jgi:hypothetical protein
VFFAGPKEGRKICKFADQLEARVQFDVALQEHQKSMTGVERRKQRATGTESHEWILDVM